MSLTWKMRARHPSVDAGPGDAAATGVEGGAAVVVIGDDTGEDGAYEGSDVGARRFIGVGGSG